MAALAFFYNAIFFTYALVLTKFYKVDGGKVGSYILPFALGNFLGPVVLGRLFDVVGRRPMLVVTYGLSGLLLFLSGVLFLMGVLTATKQTIAWMVIFFFASPAASAAYLTVSETVSDRDARLRHCPFLCVRHGDRRRRRALSIRPADRHWLAPKPVLGLYVRLRSHDRRGRRGRLLRRQGGTAIAGRRGDALVGSIVDHRECGLRLVRLAMPSAPGR